MAKKSKADVQSLRDQQFIDKVKDSAHQIWLAGLGAYAKAQEGGHAAFERLLKEGETIQKKTKAITEDRIADIAAKATGKWDRLELVFERRVANAMKTLGVTTRKDVETLSKRIDQLSEKIKALNGENSKPPVKPAAKPVEVKSKTTAARAKAAKPATKVAAAK